MPACRPMTQSVCAFGILLLTYRAAIAQDVIFPGETWKVVSPEEMYVDSAKLEAAIAKLPNSSRTMVSEMVELFGKEVKSTRRSASRTAGSEAGVARPLPWPERRFRCQ